jgi:S-adenosylhomocysteine hydrolase
MRVALFGLGTIGMEVYARLRDLGALVAGYDLDDSRRTEFRMKGGELFASPADAVRGKKLVIGCSGRQSITKDVIANLDHGAYVASGSSDLVEIDRDYLEDRKITSLRLGIGDRDWEPARLWAGTRYTLPGKPVKEITLMADGFPVTFWGFAGMPHQGGDLIMSVILIAAADLAARNGAPGGARAYGNRIERHAVDDLGKEYEIEAEYLRQYFPDAKA